VNTKRNLSRYVNIIFQVFISILLFAPFYFMLVSSVKTNEQILGSYFGIQFPMHFEYYARSFQKVIIYIKNSVIISFITLAGVSIVSSLTAYVFARYSFFGKKVLFILLLSFLMIPGVLTLIPQFVLIVKLGINNTSFACILPYIATGQIVFIFILRTFIEEIPRELFDSANIDGAGDIRIFSHIVYPLSKSMILSLGLMNLIFTWNDFIWPLTVLSSDSRRTITIGLYSFLGKQNILYGLLFAGFVIASVPVIVLFSLNMRNFIRGITAGGIKA